MKRFVVLLGIGTGLMLMTACSSDRTATVSAAAAAPPVAAPARQVAAKTSNPEYFETSGPVVVENQVDVAAQREGVVAQIMVDVGTPVHKGQILAQLDDRQLTADRDGAAAKVQSADASLRNWNEEVKVLETDLARDEALFKAKLITELQLEHSRYKLAADRFDAERAVHGVTESKNALKSLQLEWEKTRITAPFNGVVARRYVRAGQKVAIGDRLFWVTATSPLNVRFTLPQEFVGKIKIGSEVRVAPPFEPSSQKMAKVTLVSPVVDPSSATIEVQAQVQGPPGDLRPGMTVNVRVRNP